jgi:hypothetical protein
MLLVPPGTLGGCIDGAEESEGFRNRFSAQNCCCTLNKLRFVALQVLNKR